VSYAHGTSSKSLIGETIGTHFDSQVKRHRDVDALIVKHQNIRWTYGEFSDKVNKLAQNFMALGIRPGDRVGIWSPNCYEWTLTQFATAKMGAILVNINPAYQENELHYALNAVQCKALVLAPSLKTTNYINIVNTLAPELSVCFPGDLQSEALPHLKTLIRLGDATTPGMFNFDEVLNMNRSSELALENIAAELQFDDAINIQFTSGTTGRPKGATLTHHNILNNGFFVGEGIQLQRGEKVCIPVPLYHCFGMVMGNIACMTHGATMVYPSPVFDPILTLRTVEEEKCEVLYGVPTMMIAQLEHRDFRKYNLSSLRTGILAGSLAPTHVMSQVQKDMHMQGVTICYGMTETSPVSTQTSQDAPFNKRVSTVGRVHPHVEIKVVDSNGRITPRGRTGELMTRGYSVMKGYWGDQAKTDEAITEDGWMRTGDLAVMDEDGYVCIEGRLKDMIIRGGENVYPKEIEEFLYTHPSVQDVQVVGVPDSKYGEEIGAFVIKRPDAADIGSEEIRAYCKGKISHFKVPKYIRFVESFPLTVSGKIKKFELRDMLSAELRGE